MIRPLPAAWTRLARVVWTLTALLLLVSLGAVFFYAPVESVMGPVQKIVYVHVPSAMATLIAFGLSFASGIAYLSTRRRVWDAVGASSCEVGLVFATVVMITGPLWARSAWNTWWTWEPRLTTFLILWILYAGYHVVRGSIRSGAKAAISAVMSIVFFVTLPIVWKSVEWWRGSLHPKNVTMGPEMRVTLLVSMAAWLLFYLGAMERRLRLEWAQDSAERRAEMAHAPPLQGLTS